jgi:hypothetical protein
MRRPSTANGLTRYWLPSREETRSLYWEVPLTTAVFADILLLLHDKKRNLLIESGGGKGLAEPQQPVLRGDRC